jgi:pimeloyl-ACP methyl ester carboxylesterase
VKEPLLLIHGFTDTATTWSSVRPLLEPHHQVLAPTLMGHRGGPPVAPGTTNPMTAMADDLERRLDEAGIEKAHLVGNSLGGWLAFELGNRGRGLSIVAISPALGWETEHAPRATQRVFKVAHRAIPFSRRAAKFLATRPGLRKLAFRDLIAHPERVRPNVAYELIMGSTECSMYEPFLAYLDERDYRARWNEFEIPTRIAWGRKDRTLPFKSCTGWYKTSLPDAEWVELPDCGHLAQHDDPELVAKTILEVTSRAAVPQLG